MNKSHSRLPHIRGTARRVDFRDVSGFLTETETGYRRGNPEVTSQSYVNNSQVLTFRIEITDKEGNIVSCKQVMLEAEKIVGIICEGDVVEVIGEESVSGIRNPFRIINLTTGTEITTNQVKPNNKPKPNPPFLLSLIKSFFMIIFAFLFIALVLGTVVLILFLVGSFLAQYSEHFMQWYHKAFKV